MSLVAPIVDGQLKTSSTSSDSLAGAKNKSSVDSDTFLTLLVAEMQNQDPLEPTSNTEWVSQYATFTQVEQMTEMGESMDLLRANSMIGKEVVMKVTSESTGETSYKRGTVDYVTVEDGEALLVIDEEKYSISDLDSVASEEYFTAYDLYTEFVGMIDALPNLNLLDKSYENTVGKVYELYSGLDEYQKNYIDKYAAGYVSSYQAYIKKMEQLGITFGKNETTEEKVTTLDDVLDAFNKKMDALMTQITTLNTNIQNNTSGSQTSGSTNAGNIDGVGETTEGTQGTDNTGGSEATDGTQSSESAGGSEVTDGIQSSDNTEASDAAGNTQSSASTEAGQENSETQTSDATQGNSSIDNTQSSDNAENGGSTDNAQEENVTENTEPSGDGSEATEDMLDQLTQDAENV